MNIETVQALFVALLIGFVIGLQRTMRSYYQNGTFSSQEAAGSRTFALISLGGYLSALLAQKLPWLAALLSAGIILLILLSYLLKVQQFHKHGMTTQVAALITLALGIMVALGWQDEAVFIGVAMVVILELKPYLQRIETHIDPAEIRATVLLLAMTFLVLPILPDRMVGPYDLINPYKTWLMAVIIAAISYIGYIAIRILGNKRGVMLTGLFGGLISSTAVTITLSKLATWKKMIENNLAAGIAIACTIMYLRVLFEASLISQELAKTLALPFLLAAVGGLVIVYIFYRHASSQSVDITQSILGKNPLQLSEAIKFALLFGMIYGVITVVKSHFGTLGVYAVAALSGLGDVDAITLSLSELASEHHLPLTAAAYGIIIASVSNSLVKLGITFYLAGRELGLKMALFFLITLGLMFIGFNFTL
jgi:uncharacterized membrane protein (DUF4010 family)